MLNRRRQYRVSPEFSDIVRIELLGPKVHARSVTLLDLSAGGAGVELPTGAKDLLQVGDLVQLRVSSDRLPAPLDMHGRLSFVSPDARPKIGIAFLEWRQHRVILDSELRSLFNEREAFRVEPDTKRPIDVVIEQGAVRATARVRDISVLGVGLTAAASLVESLSPDRPVRLQIHLPEVRGAITVAGDLRHARVVDGASAVLGFRFEDAATLSPTARRAVGDYVMGRQREVARLGLRQEVWM